MDRSRGLPLIELESTCVGKRRKTVGRELLRRNQVVISPDSIRLVSSHVEKICQVSISNSKEMSCGYLYTLEIVGIFEIYAEILRNIKSLSNKYRKSKSLKRAN